jgi:hypothetical protein
MKQSSKYKEGILASTRCFTRGRDQMRKKVGRDSSACDKERYKIDDEEILCERDLFKLVGDLSWKTGATCLGRRGRVVLGAT